MEKRKIEKIILMTFIVIAIISVAFGAVHYRHNNFENSKNGEVVSGTKPEYDESAFNRYGETNDAVQSSVSAEESVSRKSEFVTEETETNTLLAKGDSNADSANVTDNKPANVNQKNDTKDVTKKSKKPTSKNTNANSNLNIKVNKNQEKEISGEDITSNENTVTISIDAKVIHLGMLIKPKKIKLHNGDNVAEIFRRTMKNSGYTYSFQGTVKSGFYLESIAKPGMLQGWKIDESLKKEILEDGLMFNTDSKTGNYVYDKDSLSELDFCQGSGWNYSVNGIYPEHGMSDYFPKGGDKIEIRYTLAYGKDIGVPSSAAGMFGTKEKYDNVY